MAQTEPTMDQVYQEAQAGGVGHALQLMQPVLRAHPNSAKAHYVQAELLARQGAASKARDALREAEQLAPGLPFARADAVQALRRELASVAPAAPPAAALRSSVSPAMSTAIQQAGSHATIPWGVVLAVCGGALLAWALMRLSKPGAATGAPLGTGQPGPGAVPAWSSAGPGPAYAGASAGPGLGLGAAGAPSMGSQLAGGLTTGLAVGAGVMAAQAIGKSLFGSDQHPAGGYAAQPGSLDTTRFAPIPDDTNLNPDMGGNDFGIQTADSWDADAAAASSGGWDS